MRTYETIFILKPELSAEEHEKHIEFYKENITANGGEIVKVDVWGRQALAYPIQKHTDGYYVLIQFKADTNYANDELEKRIQYKENITSNGGEIVKVDVWGRQALAYPIEKHNEGYYVLIQFKADTNYTNDELEKRFQFNENVIRYVIVMLDEKRFKQNPRKEPVRKERPAGEKVSRPRNENEEEADEMQ